MKILHDIFNTYYYNLEWEGVNNNNNNNITTKKKKICSLWKILFKYVNIGLNCEKCFKDFFGVYKVSTCLVVYWRERENVLSVIFINNCLPSFLFFFYLKVHALYYMCLKDTFEMTFSFVISLKNKNKKLSVILAAPYNNQINVKVLVLTLFIDLLK